MVVCLAFPSSLGSGSIIPNRPTIYSRWEISNLQEQLRISGVITLDRSEEGMFSKYQLKIESLEPTQLVLALADEKRS